MNDEYRPGEDQPTALQVSNTALEKTGREGLELAARIQSRMVVAQQIPRSIPQAFQDLIAQCDRPTFAKKCRYSFPRGGKPVTGATVALARQAAAAWQHNETGYRVIENRDDRVTVQGYFTDLARNVEHTSERSFSPLIQRKVSGETRWVQPDARDLQELIAREGAKAERNAILHGLPPDLIEEALETAQKAENRAAGVPEKREDQMNWLLKVFNQHGVSVAELERYLGHPFEQVTEDERGNLKLVYDTLEKGDSDWATWCPPESQESTATEAALAAVKGADDDS